MYGNTQYPLTQCAGTGNGTLHLAVWNSSCPTRCVPSPTAAVHTKPDLQRQRTRSVRELPPLMPTVRTLWHTAGGGHHQSSEIPLQSLRKSRKKCEVGGDNFARLPIILSAPWGSKWEAAPHGLRTLLPIQASHAVVKSNQRKLEKCENICCVSWQSRESRHWSVSLVTLWLFIWGIRTSGCLWVLQRVRSWWKRSFCLALFPRSYHRITVNIQPTCQRIHVILTSGCKPTYNA